MFNFSEKRFDVVSCGEIIMRLSPAVGKVLVQDGPLDRNLGGAELNVVTGISSLGGKTSFLSKIPDHDLGTYAKRCINLSGVNSDFLVYDSSKNKRLALYYYEYGASPRKPSVVYDRNDSSFQFFLSNELNDEVYSQTKVFHTSGISLGLCENSKQLVKDLIKNFKEAGAVISFDVNFRRNLWGDEKYAREEIEKILPSIDILFASEETLRKMFGQTGDMKDIMRNFTKEHNISLLISTQRTVNSPKSHNFTSIIYSSVNDEFYFEEPYKNIEIVDRIGSGDAYVAGALYGLTHFDCPKKALKFGNALGTLKNTLLGDVVCFSKANVEAIIKDHEEGSTSEMNR